MKVPVDVIINAGSGLTDKAEEGRRFIEMLREQGIESRILLARGKPELLAQARRAARGSSPIVVAAGGDGTLNAVASELVGTKKVLGVLPFGTFNHFAKDVGIPLDLEGATRTILAGHSRRVDVGEVNGRFFLNNSSLGIYPSIVHHRERRQSLGYGKWPAFFWAALAVLQRYPFLDVRLKVDGQEFSRKTPFVFIGNNEYEMERLNIGARSCLDAGQLSLYVTHRTGRSGLVALALRALFGRLSQAKDFTALCVKELWVETKYRRMLVSMDGEVTLLETPLHYQVHPGALRVLLPQPETGAAKSD